jgi:hypothetical protein
LCAASHDVLSFIDFCFGHKKKALQIPAGTEGPYIL